LAKYLVYVVRWESRTEQVVSGRNDIAEILLKVTLNREKINQTINPLEHL
jgi:hypothetical protein